MIKKNVWIINQFAGDNKSGWGERHFFLSKYINDSEYETTIISSSFTHVFKYNRENKKNFEIENCDGINFCWVKTPKYRGDSIMRFYSMFLFMVKLFFLNTKKLNKPDIILVSSMPIFPVIPALFLKWKYKSSQFIFEVRDFWPLTPIMLGNISKFNPLIIIMGIIQKIAFKKADKIVSVPSNPFQYIETIIGKTDKIFHIPNGAIIKSTSDSINDEVESILKTIPKNKFIVGYAGTFGIANALDNLIEAAKILEGNSNIIFALLGDGYLKQKLQELAGNLKNIIWLDKIPKSQVPFFLERINVGIICWKNTPLYNLGVSPNKYFDYMSCSIPIIISGAPLKDPAIESGCAFLAKPEDPLSISEAILSAYEMNVNQLKEKGTLGYNYFIQHHNYKTLADNYIEILKK